MSYSDAAPEHGGRPMTLRECMEADDAAPEQRDKIRRLVHEVQRDEDWPYEAIYTNSEYGRRLDAAVDQIIALLQRAPVLSTPVLRERIEIADELEKLAFMVGPRTHDLAEIIRGRPEYPRGNPLYQEVRMLLNRAARALQNGAAFESTGQ